MNSVEVEQLLDRAAADQAFAVRLFRDPQGAARELGMSMSDAEAAEIQRGMRQATESGSKILIFPVPIFSGDPDGKPKPKPKNQ